MRHDAPYRKDVLIAVFIEDEFRRRFGFCDVSAGRWPVRQMIFQRSVVGPVG